MLEGVTEEEGLENRQWTGKSWRGGSTSGERG